MSERLFEFDNRPPHQRSRSDPGAMTAGKARRDASDTMRASARRVMPKTGTYRRYVLDAIGRSYGLTDEEIQAALGMAANTERPRRVELVEMGWLVDSMLRRSTSSGSQAIVWTLADDARAEWEAGR